MTDLINNVAIALAGGEISWRALNPEQGERYRTSAGLAIRAIYIELERQGWQVVPKLCTWPMLDAASGELSTNEEVQANWGNMLANAPEPPGMG